jgi:hypothetical protein
MLKRQVELHLSDTREVDGIWESIPDRWRQQVVACYARLIGNAAKAESSLPVKKEKVENGPTDEP